MMNNGANPCYPNGVPYGLPADQQAAGLVISNSSMETTTSNSSHHSSFLYNLSILKDKVHQVQSLASIFMSPHESTAIVIPTMGTEIQEIIVAASSMMFSCQQMSLGSSPTTFAEAQHIHRPSKALPEPATTSRVVEERAPTGGFFSDQTMIDHWYGEDSYNDGGDNIDNNRSSFVQAHKKEVLDVHSQLSEAFRVSNSTGGGGKHDIIELAAADLLAKYTHYCHVCGKGFKRDANLRMHMRAHGDEYKSSAALSNPSKNTAAENAASAAGGAAADGSRPKYSCPQEGCRWNKNHAKFQPLKSMICVKNHYKRSHCPKMYVCKRCNRKQFSVLSDLRTHEKHCGDLKWQCSCGTTFSRKDKLMGHVALFVGHMPAANSAVKMGNAAGGRS